MDLEDKIQKVLEDHGVRFKPNARSFVVNCPRPNCGKEGHCYIQKSDGRTKCFKCSTGWDAVGIVSEMTHCGRDKAHVILFGRSDTSTSLHQLDVGTLINAGALETENLVQEVPLKSEPLGPDFVAAVHSDDAMRYLAKRGVTDPALIHRYDLRYHGFMHAVVFPVIRDGKYYGWQARVIPPRDGELRLITKPKFNKGRFLLNWDNASRAEAIVMTEGPFDCIKSDVKPGVSAVCSFGKGTSDDQLSMILASPAKRIYLGHDPDAVDEVDKLSDILCVHKEVYRLVPPEGKKDLGECSREEVIHQIDNAQEIPGYLSGRLEVYLKDKRIK
jgi:hypothetical protein